MIEDQIDKLRKEYIKASPDSLDALWQDLSGRLPIQNRARSLSVTRALIFALTILLATGGLLGAAQAGKPGDLLYPVKLLADEIVANITGKLELKIEKRAEEVIESVKGSPKQQEEALREYQKTLEEIKEQAQKRGKKDQLKEALEKQEEKLKNAQQQNPSQNLQEAIEHTQTVKGEVQGQKDEKGPSDNNSNQNRQNQNNQ